MELPPINPNIFIELGLPLPPVEKDKYFDYLQQLNNEQLILLYRRLWHYGSHGRFAQLYNINAGNFSKWLAGKKGSPSSAEAVRNFLFTYGERQNKIQSSNIEFKPLNLNSTITQLMNNEFDYLFIVDGDHASDKILKMRQIADIYSIQVVICIGRQIPKSILSFIDHDWVIVCQTQTSSKDAADCLIQAIIFLLYEPILRTYQIPVIIISGDGINQETVANLRLFDHQAYLILDISLEWFENTFSK